MASDLTRAVDVARCEAVQNYPLGSRTLEAVQNNPGYLFPARACSVTPPMGMKQRRLCAGTAY